MTPRPRWLLAVALCAACALPRIARAQDEVARADAALRVGQVATAEALYFAAARRQPRDPAARFALGEYLASRGAWRIAGVLIEEARRFGGDPVRAAQLLAPIYARTGAYTALLGLREARLPPGEAARARWLRANAESFAGPDSARLPLLGAGDARSLGAVRLLVGSDTIVAQVDPAISGLLLDRAHIRTPGVRSFDPGADGVRPAAASRIALGMMTMRNVAVALGDAGGAGHARVGLDWLGRWAPTIDLRARSVTLRRAGRVPAGAINGRTERTAVLQSRIDGSGQRVAGPWIPSYTGYSRLTAESVLRMRPQRVTYDPRVGDLLLDR